LEEMENQNFIIEIESESRYTNSTSDERGKPGQVDNRESYPSTNLSDESEAIKSTHGLQQGSNETETHFDDINEMDIFEEHERLSQENYVKESNNQIDVHATITLQNGQSEESKQRNSKNKDAEFTPRGVENFIEEN
jgi:hypothetical protein